ncbi:NADPH-dependent FMN reductase [Tropicimonas sp. IMCC34043]|uniref:NADPH-dependent FMN reductase n=1 Tax=Tropicimonas sp. IMCC34043 TaxID=2248760 RepID=UPI000E2382F7|nr:NADPH-dependent FMN reductase [Tropicimonas sp. IMCC34043]
MTRILGLSGSLRKASFNAGLLRAAAELTPEGATLTIASIAGVPLYNGDDEAANGTPAPVQALRDQLAEADGLLLASPEYNNGIPGVFKNAIDWMASGKGADVFVGKPVAVIGASPMAFGTVLAQDQWLPVLRTLKTRPWFEGRLMVGRARDLFDAEGNLTDEATRDRLTAFVEGFVASI